MKVDLSTAMTMIEAARAEATTRGRAVTIAVVDAGGNLVAQQRMDGACLATIQLSADKAFSALAMMEATHSYAPHCQPGGPLVGIQSSHGGRIVALPGGLPVVSDGRFVGGIGVSGAPAEDDVACGRAALAAAGADPVD